MCGGLWTIFRSHFSPTMWVPGIDPRDCVNLFTLEMCIDRKTDIIQAPFIIVCMLPEQNLYRYNIKKTKSNTKKYTVNLGIKKKINVSNSIYFHFRKNRTRNIILLLFKKSLINQEHDKFM